MPKKKAEVAVEEQVQFNTKGMTEEQIVDVICNSLDTFAHTLAERGLDSDLITASLFRVFAERMCEAGDRETYEEVLTLALEDEWEEVTLH